MSSFHELFLGFTERIHFEEDFTYEKRKEELALKARSDYVPWIRKHWGTEDVEVSMDERGDIDIRTNKGLIFFTRQAVSLVAWNLTAEAISRIETSRDIAAVLDEAFQLMTPLRPLRYELRLFRTLRFTEPIGNELIENPNFGSVTNKLSPHLVPTNLLNQSTTATFRESEFTDTIFLKVEKSEMEVRYVREAPAGQRGSYVQFLGVANVGSLVERMGLLLDPFIQNPSRIRGKLFQTTKP